MPVTSVSIQTASAAAATSNVVVCNWRCGKPIFWNVTVSSSIALGDFTVQYTLDDIQLTTYLSSLAFPPTGSPTAASTTVYWSAVSSNPYTTVGSTGAAGVHFNSSNIFPDGVSGTFLAPPAALRIYSTSTSSGVLTLKVIQADGS